ncbi:MAG: hypothetical protein II484_05480 [Bacteroidaceae bacterium]|nr:hypothetical protein [Bacteroidaceae bacterium]
MKRPVIICLIVFVLAAVASAAQTGIPIGRFGVSPKNTAAQNRQKLQRAIDRLSASGGALYVEPVEGGYPMDGGLVLRKNVSLIGVHGPTGRGTSTADATGPTGSLFVIRDRSEAFIRVESGTRLSGIQFYYPEQSWDRADGIVAYPPTITLAEGENVEGVTLRDLTFYGEYFAMDFRATPPNRCEQILIEHCYGYPLSGQFIAINHCTDIPRLLHCHVNPANMRAFGRHFKPEVIDRVVSQKKYTYWIDYTDNAQMMDLFTFGNYGGVCLGRETYGQLTNFNFDCVQIGIYKDGSNQKNRNWQISQGSIIANTGERAEDVHPIVIKGCGHTSLTNVEAFSGGNPVLTDYGASQDFLLTIGDEPGTITLTGCRMQGYTADKPLTLHNPNARVRAIGCVDKEGNFFDL